MTIPDALRIAYMCCYLIVTSQLLFYRTVLSSALRRVSIDNFLEQRKVIDTVLVKRIKIPYYLCLFLNFIVLGISLGLPNPVFQTSLIAFGCLTADVIIALRYNGPLNKLTSAWPENVTGADWQQVRSQWLKYINIRAIFITIGMISLIAGSIMGK